MNCKICDGSLIPTFKTAVLKKHQVQYFQCENCNFVQTENPYWLKEAYNNAINLSDTGLVLRNTRYSRIITSLICIFFNKKQKFIDYAGGLGLFTRIMRDIGFDYYWMDLYAKNELARGFEYKKGEKYHLITCFECFEHFNNPIEETKKILELSENLIFSTELIPKPLPKIDDWWYYAPEHGQHIAFYSKKSFEILAQKLSLNYYNLDNIHILTKKNLGLKAKILLTNKYSKHILYFLSFIFENTIKTKTFEDMKNLK
jgi:hypothetical protein